MSGLCTVMCKNMVPSPETGELEQQGVNALIVTPDMEGVEVFEKNRAKTGIRGTWQARFRFNDVRVPKENVLHEEGKGLKVALSCLNYGRCTLSAGVTGAAKAAKDQGIKWAQTRYQFDRPLADFELVQQKIARMSAVTYAMDAMLYMMTGLLDRGETDIMVETAITKVFCSEFGWKVIDEAMQIMGGEGYMTEHELERSWRDNRIHSIVEGSNEVMQSFIFAYGGKQLAEKMVSIQEALLWDSDESVGDNLSRILTAATTPAVLKKALPMGPSCPWAEATGPGAEGRTSGSPGPGRYTCAPDSEAFSLLQAREQVGARGRREAPGPAGPCGEQCHLSVCARVLAVENGRSTPLWRVWAGL
jgi:Acyl-CoA dehydrogenases